MADDKDIHESESNTSLLKRKSPKLLFITLSVFGWAIGILYTFKFVHSFSSYDSLVILTLIVAIQAIVTGIIYWRHRKNHPKDPINTPFNPYLAADESYYLGFMFTMTSLAVTAFWGIENGSQGTTSLAQTLIQSTVALVTTIIGLISRHIFLALLPEPSSAMEECCEKIVQALGVGPDEVVKATHEAAKTISDTTGQMTINFTAVTGSARILHEQFGALNARVGELEKSVSASAKNTVDKLSEATQALDATMEGAGQRIKKFEGEIGETLADKLTDALTEQLSGLSLLVTRFTQNLDNLPNLVGAHVSAIDGKVADHVDMLKGQVADFINKEKATIMSPITTLAAELKGVMDKFSKDNNESQEEFKGQIDALIGICKKRAEGVFADNEKKINASTDSLKGILTALDTDMRTRIGEAIDALRSVANIYAEAMRQNANAKGDELERLKTASQNVDEAVEGLYEVYNVLYDASMPERRTRRSPKDKT